MQKALSCANVNDKPVNPLKLMAHTAHAALVGFTCKFVCKVLEHFVEHDIPLISVHVWFQWQGLASHIPSMPWAYLALCRAFPILSQGLCTLQCQEQPKDLSGHYKVSQSYRELIN